jgi:hypothetical protein
MRAVSPIPRSPPRRPPLCGASGAARLLSEDRDRAWLDRLAGPCRTLKLRRLLVAPRREREDSVVIGIRETRRSVRAHACGEPQVLRLLLSANGTRRRSAVREQVMAVSRGGPEARRVGIELARRDLDVHLVTRLGDLRVGIAGHSVQAHAPGKRDDCPSTDTRQSTSAARVGRMGRRRGIAAPAHQNSACRERADQ